MAGKAVAYAAERMRLEPRPLGPHGQRLTFDEAEVRWLAPVPRPPMIRDGILLLDHYRVGMERLFKIGEKDHSVGFELDRWIKPGDVVECEIEGVGTLSNPVARE